MPDSLQKVSHKLNYLNVKDFYVSLTLSAIVFNHRKYTLSISYTLHSLKYQLVQGNKG